MKMQDPLVNAVLIPEFLSRGGEMGTLIREYDWSATSLGPVESWQQSLRSALGICLNSNFPIAIYWGKDLTLIYNDAWSPIPGNKHPWALGRPAREVWPEIWKDIEPQFEKAFNGEPGGSKDALLPMHRHGYTEECYFDFTFTPVYGEGGKVEGVFNAVIETTKTILNERQLKTLRNLGNLNATGKTVTELLMDAGKALEKNNKDFPFGIIYKIEEQEMKAIPVSYVGVSQSQTVFPSAIDLKDPGKEGTNFHTAYSNGEIVISDNNGRRPNLPKGGWDKEATHFMHLPIITQHKKTPIAIFSAALNPYRRFDEVFRQFAQLIADQISAEVNNVIAYEEERKRAEALAEIDRAKTAFFTNISHEFRTPLTLMLGTIEEALNDPKLESRNRKLIDVTHRNAMRMLKLVNTLLDFSRLEAGKVKPHFQLTDIAAYTADLASSFSSVMENAGLKFNVQCESNIEPIYIDREMWEKIVFNLLSNAFKYTLKGQINLVVSTQGENILLKVADTGVGIPEHELPKMFQRFHRVEKATGRSYEGTGIGLSLVKELVQLHEGTISAISEEGKGSEFIVTFPVKRNMPEAMQSGQVTERIAKPLSQVFIQEATTLVDQQDAIKGADIDIIDKEKATILVADDNADMRQHLKTLLRDKFNVITATNGQEAFDRLKKQDVDLVVSDVMMPGMNGIQLLKALKEYPKTKNIPIILLSARAGEEAKIEGYETGADDYLIKPFAAKELLARVTSHVKLSKARRDVETQLKSFFVQAPAGIAIVSGPEFVYTLANKLFQKLFGKTEEELIGMKMKEIWPELQGQEALKTFENIRQTGNPLIANEFAVSLVQNGKSEMRYFDFVAQPIKDEDGKVNDIMIHVSEITERIVSRKKLEESESRFRTLAETLPQIIWVSDEIGNNEYYSHQWSDYSGIENPYEAWDQMIHPDDKAVSKNTFENARAQGSSFCYEVRLKNRQGEYRWHKTVAEPVKDDSGRIVKWIGSMTDIHDQKTLSEKLARLVAERTAELEQANMQLYRSNEDLQQFAHVASHDLKEPVRKIKTFGSRLKEEFEVDMPDTSRLYLSKIETAANRMYSMIEGVLRYSTLSATELIKEPVSLLQIMQNIETDLEVPISEKRAVIRYDSFPLIEGSPILLYQLFYNLVNNSLKFSKADTAPVISISAKEPDQVELINSRLDPSKQYIKLMVQDNGIGFEQSEAEKIFGSFTRLNSKDKYEGTGLGLSLCKKIVERHKGSIVAKSAENEGAKFIILLPVN
jgi:PAS domain S-box-containing protein